MLILILISLLTNMFFFDYFDKKQLLYAYVMIYVFYIKSRDIWTQLLIIDCIDLSYILLFAKKKTPNQTAK